MVLNRDQWRDVFTCSASAGQQLLRIVVVVLVVVLVLVVVTKLNYLRRWVFLVPLMSFLLLLDFLPAVPVLVLVVFCCFWAIEIFSIAIENLMDHGLPIQFGPLNFAAGH